MVAVRINPAAQRDFLPDVVQTQFAAGMGSVTSWMLPCSLVIFENRSILPLITGKENPRTDRPV